jgi:hypothetical protein
VTKLVRTAPGDSTTVRTTLVVSSVTVTVPYCVSVAGHDMTRKCYCTVVRLPLKARSGGKWVGTGPLYDHSNVRYEARKTNEKKT